MADNLSLSLIGAMDRLWFHQIILFPEPISLFSFKPLKPQQPYSESTATPTSPSATSLAEDNISTPVCPLFDHQPLAPARLRNHRHSTSRSLGGKLKKSTSCKSLEDLELEEVKGFMDLGFKFKKEHLDSRMIDVVPGLLRLGFLKTQPNLPADEHEAWLIKRPDSPLLNLKVPRVSAAADMKKHLKCWARTVASVVQQEC
ncbi:hypothetical protein GOBAR_DD20290 [Gossypium barbadense]|nr:hypothetical protein GOBAR_DD20290 [Gossypium barbadense]